MRVLTGIVVLLAATLAAQQPANVPHAGYAFPAGGRQGTTVEVTIGGQFLDGPTRAIVSGDDVRARVVKYDKPLNGQALTDLRDKVQELQKRATEPGVAQEIAKLRARVVDSARRNAIPALGELVTVELSIGEHAAVGPRQLRLVTNLGLTNPVTVIVGDLPEVLEAPAAPGTAGVTSVSLPAVINGRLAPTDVQGQPPLPNQPNQILFGDVDRYRFTAHAGDDLVAAVAARDLLPYLADAVPGWLQATLTLRDSTGHELAFADDDRFRPDPVLHLRVPADGEYVLEIKDALSRGREDFVYRVAVGKLPYITSVFPLGGRAGAATKVAIAGWNLPSATIDVDGRGAAGLIPLSLRAAGVNSNTKPFALDSAPEIDEREPNGDAKSARAVTLPAVVNGRIGTPGDWDVFSFRRKAGETIVAETFARRLDSPLDSTLDLLDASGRTLASSDDCDDKTAGLVTHQADSRIQFTLPSDGTYFLRLGDAQGHGGTDYAYRLRVTAPQPDFSVRVSPSSLALTTSGTTVVTATAIRRDGFTGDIALSLRDAADGFTISGGVIPAGVDAIRFTITAPPDSQPDPRSMHLEGLGMVQGRAIVHDAAPADDLMQAFAYHHLVAADEWRIAVGGRGGTRVPTRIMVALPARIAAGGSARITVALPPAYRSFVKVEFELSQPPTGVTISDSAVGALGGMFTLHVAPAGIAPGTRGNLIVTVSGERVPPPGQAATAARRRVTIGILPAIPFEIIR